MTLQSIRLNILIIKTAQMICDKQCVFVVGVPRSGTTWLFKMLAAHPGFCSLNGANTLFQNYIFPMEKAYRDEEMGLKNKGFDRGMPSKLDPTEFHKLLLHYVDFFYENFSITNPFYVEKATDLLDQTKNILRFVPNAKFIHIVRDGRDSALSDIKYRKKYGFPLGIENIYEAAQRWKNETLSYRQQMRLHPEQMMELKYEDLLSNTSLKLHDIFEFIGCHSTHELSEQIAKKFDHRTNMVSKPTSDIADKAGRPLHPYFSEMTKKELAIFECIAGDTLIKYGYPKSKLMCSTFVAFYIKWFCVSRYFAIKSGRPLKFWRHSLKRRWGSGKK